MRPRNPESINLLLPVVSRIAADLDRGHRAAADLARAGSAASLRAGSREAIDRFVEELENVRISLRCYQAVRGAFLTSAQVAG